MTEDVECHGGPLDGLTLRCVDGVFLGVVCPDGHLTPWETADDGHKLIVRSRFAEATCDVCGTQFL